MNYFLLLVAYLAPSCGAFTSIRLPAPSSLSNSHGETSSSHHKERYTSVNTRLNVAKDIDDSPDAAEFLQLSSSDLSRLAAVRDRRLEMPILILEPLLPGQRLQFGSPDPKFAKLIAHSLSSGSGEIGMLGLNPHTNRPLNMGVTVQITPSSVRNADGMLSVDVVGKNQFEVEGEPWMDDTDSFYIADVEMVADGSNEVEDGPEQIVQASTLSAAVPRLMESWMEWMIQSGVTGRSGIEAVMKKLGPMPDNVGDRAIWIASLLNPVPAYETTVCLEIRPALLACKTDLERINLTVIALQSSIDHISGKRRLF
mmetsp:Transcript_26715/g.58484  ORF Transcript_26715/g.58484 Transcript_26715/m.58484 type:complete len:312 (-) Transcript_26715:308-1243(-)